jgi:hypothetical protein
MDVEQQNLLRRALEAMYDPSETPEMPRELVVQIVLDAIAGSNIGSRPTPPQPPQQTTTASGDELDPGTQRDRLILL